MAVKIFVDKMKLFSLKRRLDDDDFENDLEALFPPVNEVVDKVASALSESLINLLISKQNGKISNQTKIARI